MKAYGYIREGGKGPVELSEVTLSANPAALKEIASFLMRCAKEIESQPNHWSHEHISWKCIKSGKHTPEFIVSNPRCE